MHQSYTELGTHVNRYRYRFPHTIDGMPKVETKSLGEILCANVKKAMKAHAWTQNATVLRAKTKIGQGVAADILKGIADPKLSTVEKIASKFKVAGWQFLQPEYEPPTDLSKDEAEGLEKIRAALASLSPAQRKALALSDDVQKLLTTAVYDPDKMSPEWDASNKKK